MYSAALRAVSLVAEKVELMAEMRAVKKAAQRVAYSAQSMAASMVGM